jgi:pimeloyl-ACP methyl ester carboxylesterase
MSLQRFNVQRTSLRGVEIAYVQEGEGGFPLVLLHGWPETMRIWWRNIEPLAAAGFEVIVPDLRGFGASSLADDGFYDIRAHARDVHELAGEILGHSQVVTCGGDLGGVIAQELALLFPDWVVRQVLFNTVAPPKLAENGGVPREVRMSADYFIRQATDADALAAELDTADKRRRYVAQMYGPRFWAAPGGFDPEDVDFMTEPFGDAEKFRASIANYESGLRRRPVSEKPLWLSEGSPKPTLVLYGPEDHVIPKSFPRVCERVFPEIVGPFVIDGAGHFLQWERASVLNQAVRYFCLDLLGESEDG